MNTVVQKVTVKEKHQLYKGETPANSIELLSFEENGFPIVAQKDLYAIGDIAYLVEPDYCLPDIPLFESYIRPYGDASKSKLGKKHRIKAVKFNLHKGDNNPVYSYGILIPNVEMHLWCNQNKILITKADLAEELGITKYEAPDDSKGNVIGGASKPFPEGMYKTDEPNWNKVCNSIEFPIHLVGNVKQDGSSCSIFYKNNKNYGICSRNLLKPLTTSKVVGRKNPSFIDIIKGFFGINVDLLIREEVESDSDFVKYGKSILEKLKSYCEQNSLSLAVRAELIGTSSKGSGNKNNPSAKLPNQLLVFGIDDYTDSTVKLPYNEYKQHLTAMELNSCEEVFNKVFNSKEEVIEECEEYFKTHLIEGLVLRNLDSTISCKYMNLAYDNKKD
jgi:RNA ligase